MTAVGAKERSQGQTGVTFEELGLRQEDEGWDVRFDKVGQVEGSPLGPLNALQLILYD